MGDKMTSKKNQKWNSETKTKRIGGKAKTYVHPWKDKHFESYNQKFLPAQFHNNNNDNKKIDIDERSNVSDSLQIQVKSRYLKLLNRVPRLGN